MPAGTWVDWWTGDVFGGTADIDAPNPVDQPPVFRAAGAIVPMLPPGLDTLVESASPDAVDPADPLGPHRVRIVPPAEGETASWDAGCAASLPAAAYTGVATRVSVSTGTDCVDVSAETTTADPKLVLELDWRVMSADAPSRVEPASWTEAPDVETVLDGCEGCWFYDDTTGKVYASPVPERVCR